MKIKKISLMILIALSLFSLSLFAGCTKKDKANGNQSQNQQTATGEISLSVVSANMIFGDELNIICFYGGDKPVEWKSSDETVALVDDDGSVSTVGVGTCDVTAKAGDASATCKISVSMGNYLPELKVLHVRNGELALRKGESFEPEVKVLFNKVYYDCKIGFSASASGVVDYSDGKLTALSAGETTATFVGEWQSFASDKLNAELKIKVINDVVYDNVITINGEKTDTAVIELSVTPEWQGKQYPHEAEVTSSVTIDGKTYACEFSSDDDRLTLQKFPQGKVTVRANGLGEAMLVAKYVAENGKTYETKIPVDMYCPTEVYGGQLDFCPTQPLNVAEIFGTQYAKVLSATQNGRELTAEFNYIKGVKVDGEDTEPMTVLTSVGGFVFDDVFAYDVELNKDNIFDALQLGKGNLIKDGYYILNTDIDTAIDFTLQNKSVYNAGSPANNTYFCGTFDGRGHTFRAKVGQQGVFGGLYDGAKIKNTEFIFEFSDKTASCGLANNEGTWNLSGGSVVLNNLRVKTTNYYKNSYALLGYCNFNLEMYDIFVELVGTDKLPDYTNVGIESEMAALFHNDYTATMASNDGKFKGGFRNIFVVTGKFMPMACGYYPYYGGYRYVSYAKNDESYLGDFKATGYSHIYTFCHVVPTDDNENKDKYFGITSYSKSSNKKYAWIFKAKEDIKDGGIERYDTALELSKKIDKIGTWDVV